MKANIPETNLKRVVIIGGGFGGLKLARKLLKSRFQVILIDKNNYHQFQPLFYQVATAGLEPSAIAFPFRKVFQGSKNIHIRITEVTSVNASENFITSSIGRINYDFLVLAMGADTNFFGNINIMKYAMPMKSVSEALGLRNKILENYEMALSTEDTEQQQALMNIVVVGGGPTGVEISGTLAEMKKHILPKDFPELNFNYMHVTLIEASLRVLNGMSDNASQKAEQYLEELGVHISTKTSVKDYDGNQVVLSDGNRINAKTLIWAAGVAGKKIDGIPAETLIGNNRIKVDRYNRVEGFENIFAIGDIAYMTEDAYPNGHPQVAQVSMQQADKLAVNLKNIQQGKFPIAFHYKNLGSMATVGRNLAVVDLPFIRFQGFFAWLVWMFVHLMSIVGIKNRLLIFINWAWNYATYDQSLRLIIHTKDANNSVK
jgi:NADH dehydrogenase